MQTGMTTLKTGLNDLKRAVWRLNFFFLISPTLLGASVIVFGSRFHNSGSAIVDLQTLVLIMTPCAELKYNV